MSKLKKSGSKSGKHKQSIISQEQYSFHQQRRVAQKIRSDNLSKYSHLSGGAPSNVRSVSASRKFPGKVRTTKSRSKSKSKAVVSAPKFEHIPTQTSFGNNTITNITTKKQLTSLMPLKTKKKSLKSSKGTSSRVGTSKHTSLIPSNNRSKSRRKTRN